MSSLTHTKNFDSISNAMYIIWRIESILQHPNFKVGVALVIISKQRSGKTEFFTDIVYQLMARNADNNITDIEDIVGKLMHH